MAYEFGNSLHWDLLLRQSYEVRPIPVPEGQKPLYLPIPPISLIVDKYIFMIGVGCNHAKPWWYLGGWATLRLLTLPSTTSDFPAAVQADRQLCRLFSLSLIRFPDLGAPSYLLNLEIPYWFKQASVEVWKYSGPTDDLDVEINLTQ